jgi:TrmH family RNA methyltransferase
MTMRITSPQNPRVKQAARLRDHRDRKNQGRFLIDGAREISRALQAKVKVLEIFFCGEMVRDSELEQSVSLAGERGVAVLEVTSAVLGKLAFGERSEGAVAVAEYPQPTWPDWQLPDNPLIVVLESVEKPGNLGGIVRTADAIGASAVVLADPAADLFNPNAIRASLGAVFSVPLAAASPAAILAWLRRLQVQVVAARVDATTPYHRVDYRRPTAIVLGSEAKGLTSLWNADDITAIALPMCGRVDSLNVSVTAGVLMYEALRQRMT